MDENKKRDLKLIFKVYEIVMYCLGLAFLVLGLCFGSIYIGRKAFSVSSVTEKTENNKQLVRRDAAFTNNDNMSFWNVNSTRVVEEINQRDNSALYNEYFYFISNTTGGQIRYTYTGDFALHTMDTYEEYNQLNFYFEQTEPDIVVLRNILLYSSSSHQRYLKYGSTISDATIVVSTLTEYLNVNIRDVKECGVFQYYFNPLFSTEEAYTYTFNSGSKNLPQYLMSYNRLQYGQILYPPTATQTDYLTIPMVFECNGRLYDNITILLRPCFFYYNSSGQLINNTEVFSGSAPIPYTAIYVLYGYYGKTLSWTFSETTDGVVNVLKSVTNGSVAMYLGYNGASAVEVSESVTWYCPNYLSVQGLQVNQDYATIRVKDIDSVPFVNTTGTNLMPYNNITIKSILETYFNFYGDVNGYNGSYYDVGLSNVFTLLSSAFQSMIPLMAIQIIPGITLGLLIMLPLIVSIILVIIKLVKK